MNRMNPITVSNDIRDTYFRYIMTRFPLGKSDPGLREQLKNLLYSSAGKPRLIKGPILEIMPPYEKGSSFKEFSIRYPEWKTLVNHFEKEGNFPVERNLFLHQQDALKKSRENNVVVSSGTGSGKTECFLFPIFQYCFDHPGEGVRAILIYPLNALVEDQIDRLSEYLRGTNITFGKYTGQTPRTKKEAEEGGEKRRRSNHLITREEMRSNPPNILVTNYTMLEYMLVRPGDSPILDKRDIYSFRFIVLDEVHTYSGTVGTEVAYLLKRLRHRVGRKTEDVRYIATSATLGAGDDILDKTVTFVQRLFGTLFQKDCIIREAKQNLSEYLPKESENDFNIEAIINWGLPGQDITPGDVKQKLGIETDVIHLKQDIYGKLMKNKYVKDIKCALIEGPKPVEELAEKLFPGNENAVNAIVNIVAWAYFAKNNSELSLIPARYHMFVSATKGIFCELTPNGSTKMWKNLALSQQDIREMEGNPYPFELGVCRVCGEPYIMGVFVREDMGIKYKPIADSFFETIDSEDKGSYKVILHPRSIRNSKIITICRLCGSVDGACIHPTGDKVKFYLLDTSQTFYNDSIDEMTENDSEETDKEGNIPKGCINCGYGRTLSQCVIPMRFLANGSTAPLMSSLFTHCPEMDRKTIEEIETEIIHEFTLNRRNRDWTPVIANGRKMLIFSDSRQEAAFFGPYMQVTHNQMVFNRIMIDILRNKNLSLKIKEWKDIADNKLSQIEDQRDRNNLAALLEQLRPSDQFKNEIINLYTRAHRIYLSIFHLIDSTASSISGLEGIGIGAVYFNSPQLAEVVDLPGFSKTQVLALAQLILRYIRLKEAFYPSPEENINISSYSLFDAYFETHPDKKILLNKEDEVKGERVIRLISRRKKLTQLQTMVHDCIARFKKIAPANVSFDEVDEVIIKISTEFINRELRPDKKGIGYQLDINTLDIMPAHPKNGNFFERIPGGLPRFKSCSKCGRLSWIDLSGLCNYPGCLGELESPTISFQMSDDNHYRNFFLNEAEIPALRAVEHTAQLDKTTAAKDFQKEFKRGRLNLLSCSTTFEMGVDLGDLSAIFMKNVPPGIANYVQRAGRAGRREGVSPFVLTYCRSLPHDQYYFNKYEMLVKGEVNPPAVVLENEKILIRHFNAIILSDFFKEYKDIFSNESSGYINDPLLSQLFDPTDKFKILTNQDFPGVEMNPSDFLCNHWLPGKYELYRNKLKEIFLHEKSFLTEPFFYETLGKFITETLFVRDESYGLKESIEKRYKGEIDYYEQEKDKCDPAKSQNESENYHRFKTLIQQTKKEQLISYLCSRGFLPSYAFPTNVVPLEILSDDSAKESLDLNRSLDRAITEYAPGSKVAANSRIYTSGALRKLPKQEFKVSYYFHCPECNWFTRKLGESQVKDAMKRHFDAFHKGEETLKRGPNKALYPEWGFSVPKDNKKKIEIIRPNTKLERTGYSSELFMDIDAFKAKDSREVKLTNQGKIMIEFANGFDMCRVNPGEIKENEAQGFTVCPKCGKALEGNERKHKSPFGWNCDQKDYFRKCHFLSIFDTDVITFTFNDCVPPNSFYGDTFRKKSFWRSVLYGFMEAISHVLEVERNDIDGLYIPLKGQPFAQLVFIDSVSGGAGHVARLVGKGSENPQVMMDAIIKEAKSVLNCKDCAENTACYSCLFHHRNQNIQHTLNRGLALEWISKL